MSDIHLDVRMLPGHDLRFLVRHRHPGALAMQARLQDAQHQPAEALRTLARAQAAASAASAAKDAPAAERHQVLQVSQSMCVCVVM